MLWDVFGAHVVLHGHDVEMGVDAMGGGGVQAVQIKSLKKKMVGAMEVWWSVPEPVQGPSGGGSMWRRGHSSLETGADEEPTLAPHPHQFPMMNDPSSTLSHNCDGAKNVENRCG